MSDILVTRSSSTHYELRPMREEISEMSPEVVMALRTQFEQRLFNGFAQNDHGLFVPTPDNDTYETAVTSAPETDHTVLSIAAVEAAMQTIRAMGPVCREIWFVDCRYLYERFLHETSPSWELWQPQLCGYGRMSGIPLRVWDREAMEPGREAIALPPGVEGPLPEVDFVWPWFCAVPGVWAQMSDGHHKYLIYPSQGERFYVGVS